mmetsp:Transcript_6767/g.14720  ORF Transcript_6767/g.14720 Transcript_6767/m.14720 type:complete len:83 (-) Transcript_6767:161-409(-)
MDAGWGSLGDLEIDEAALSGEGGAAAAISQIGGMQVHISRNQGVDKAAVRDGDGGLERDVHVETRNHDEVLGRGLWGLWQCS